MPLKVAGMTFDRQTLMLAGGAVVAVFALRSVFGTARSPLPAAPSLDVDALMDRLLEATESGARAASGGVGAGASIAIEGIASGARIADRGLDLAGDVTSVIGRIAEREAIVLGDVTERVVGALERVTTTGPRVAPPPAAVGGPAVPTGSTATAPAPAPAAPAPAAPAPAPAAPTFTRTDRGVIESGSSGATVVAPTVSAETTARIERELAARVAAGQTLGTVNVPALLRAPGVVVTDKDRQLVAAGMIPRAVGPDGRLIY